MFLYVLFCVWCLLLLLFGGMGYGLGLLGLGGGSGSECCCFCMFILRLVFGVFGFWWYGLWSGDSGFGG